MGVGILTYGLDITAGFNYNSLVDDPRGAFGGGLGIGGDGGYIGIGEGYYPEASSPGGSRDYWNTGIAAGVLIGKPVWSTIVGVGEAGGTGFTLVPFFRATGEAGVGEIQDTKFNWGLTFMVGLSGRFASILL